MTRTCTAIWLGSNKSVEVHPMITTTFGWKWGGGHHWQGHYSTPVLYRVLFTRWNLVLRSPKL
jgi:hypothetical protein